MATFLSGLASVALPFLAKEGVQVLGDFGSSLINKFFPNNRGVAELGTKAIGGIQDYLNNSLGSYGIPSPHERYRKPGMLSQSTDYPVMVRKLTGRRRPPNLRDYNEENGSEYDQVSRPAPMKARRFNNDDSIARYGSGYGTGDLFRDDEGMM